MERAATKVRRLYLRARFRSPERAAFSSRWQRHRESQSESSDPERVALLVRVQPFQGWGHTASTVGDAHGYCLGPLQGPFETRSRSKTWTRTRRKFIMPAEFHC